MSDAMCWPEQEAVWQWMKDFDIQLTFEQENALKNAVSKYRIEIQNSKQEQGEPFGTVVEYRNNFDFYRWGESPYFDNAINHWVVYTHPQPRQWVGLTPEQKLSLEIQGNKSDVLLAELVESWLKDMNT